MTTSPNKLPDGAAYPTAFGAPLDRAYLRPLRNPLRDTEIYVPDKECSELDFFRRPIDATMLLDPSRKKTPVDTSLNQCSANGYGILDYPIEYSIIGFNFLVEEAASPEDKAAILDKSLFEFVFVGRRPYAGIPLARMPGRERQPEIADYMFQIIQWALAHHDWYVCAGKDWMHEMSQSGYKTPPKGYNPSNILGREMVLSMSVSRLWDLAVKEMEAGTFDNFYPFNVGKATFRMCPGKEFCVRVKWNAPPKTSRPIRLTPLIEGYAWLPL